MQRSVTTLGLTLCAALCGGAARAGGPCDPVWLPTFGNSPGTSGSVLALAHYDDGLGSTLYVGGSFDRAGGLWNAGNVARWDGSRWATIGLYGGGFNGAVHALAVLDVGQGPSLHAAGAFSGRVQRWNGSAWVGLGSGTNGTVYALAAYDDGAGKALFAGGQFTTAGGGAASNLARWNGSGWSSVGGGTDQPVRALAVYDDGAGPALYVGGSFTSAGGVAASRIARWDGTSFAALGTAPGLNGSVQAFAVFDDGGGPALYAGGSFTAVGTLPTSRIARWDGTSWSSVGSGLSSTVQCLSAYDDGGGPSLIAGGAFDQAGGTTAGGIARWNGTTWSALGASTSASVAALAVVDGPHGARLLAGGTFDAFAGMLVDNIAAWDGSGWSALGSGPSHPVDVLEVHDDGTGPSLFAAGDFDSIGGLPARYAARWNGSAWSALPGLTRRVNALEAHDDGSGAALYAGLRGTVVRWDGASWSPLIGDEAMGPQGQVYALRSWDDGNGSALFAGGRFVAAGGVPANHIARWNGTSWSALGSGIAADGRVNALEVWDDGGGPALYVAGGFSTAGGTPAGSVARWDGSAWTGVLGLGGSVYALAVFDAGNGPELIAGGYFDPYSSVARWDGSAWHGLGPGLYHLSNQGVVEDLVVFDDGNGPALYAAGLFIRGSADIARWNGASWTAVGWGIEAGASALAVYDDGSGGGEALFLANDGVNYNTGDVHLAKWGCSGVSETTFCAGSAAACPCGNGGLPGRGCDLAQGTGGVELALVAQTSNSATLGGTGFPLGERPTVVVLRSSSLAPRPAVVGDGLSCLSSSSLVRLAAVRGAGGASTHVLGHGSDGPGLFYYQLAFRNTPATYCTPEALNLSSGLRLTW